MTHTRASAGEDATRDRQVRAAPAASQPDAGLWPGDPRSGRRRTEQAFQRARARVRSRQRHTRRPDVDTLGGRRADGTQHAGARAAAKGRGADGPRRRHVERPAGGGRQPSLHTVKDAKERAGGESREAGEEPAPRGRERAGREAKGPVPGAGA